jgi:hypothetical protein
MEFTVPRSMVKLQYTVVRLPLALVEDYVVARYWDEGAPARVAFERWLGSLDLFAGRLLDDDEISQRGRVLMRQTTDLAHVSGFPTDTPVQPVPFGQAPPNRHADIPQAGEQDRGMHDPLDGHEQTDEPEHGEPAADGQVPAATAQPTADKSPISDRAGASGQSGTPDTRAAATGTVAVTFILPAEVPATTVALCGEFNDWSPAATPLERRSDGSWRATVGLEPGRSYRYRFLLDGDRWENDSRADRYVPNAHGGTDSVVVVE